MALNEDDRRRVCRVLCAWSPKKQADLSTELGWSPDRIRNSLVAGKNSPPTTDELFELARHVGVSESFVVDGFAPPLERRVAALEETTEDHAGALERLVADLLQLGREIQELRGGGRERGPGEGSGR